MYRNKVVKYLPWIVLIPTIWMIIGLYLGVINILVVVFLTIAYGFVLSFFIYVYLKVERVILYLNKFGIENAPREYKIQDGQKYTGIVIIHNNYTNKKALTIYISAPMLFIEYLKKKNRPFRLVVDPDYKQFEKLVADPNCNELYIMGHGRLYRLIIGPNKSDTIWYRDFIGYPQKDKVVQLHCNHRDSFFKNRDLQSLTEILHSKTDYNQKGMSWSVGLIDYFLNKVE